MCQKRKNNKRNSKFFSIGWTEFISTRHEIGTIPLALIQYQKKKNDNKMDRVTNTEIEQIM
jgi:hypothetical protein